MFLRQRVKDVEKEGLVFGYQARVPNEMGQKTGLRVAIFEPNISVVKTASIPMLVCDQAYRTDPTSVNFMHALNTLHMVEHPTMLYLANSLNLVQDKKAVFPGRHDFVGYMVQHADAVISHQWANDQNYLYLDALYGNYPLIHNSPWLRDAGYSSYYYPDFDTHSGAKQLLAAAANHDAQLAHCKEQASEVIASVNPIASINLQGYAQLLLRLFNGNQSSGYSA